MKKKAKSLRLLTAALIVASAAAGLLMSRPRMGAQTLRPPQPDRQPVVRVSPERVSYEPPLTVDELFDLADTVVYGRIASLEAAWDERRANIYTTITVNVREVLKGQPGRTLNFKHLGGQVGDVRTEVSHSPTFTAGEDVLLFLNFGRAGGISPLINGNQGKFSVQRDPRTRQSVVGVGVESVQALASRTDESLTKETLEEGVVPLKAVLESLRRASRPKSGSSFRKEQRK